MGKWIYIVWNRAYDRDTGLPFVDPLGIDGTPAPARVYKVFSDHKNVTEFIKSRCRPSSINWRTSVGGEVMAWSGIERQDKLSLDWHYWAESRRLEDQ